MEKQFNNSSIQKFNPMKKQPQIIFIIVLGIYFLFNGCLPRTEKKDWQLYAIELQGEGWSKEASEHIAKVEFKIIPEDSLYIAYMED